MPAATLAVRLAAAVTRPHVGRAGSSVLLRDRGDRARSERRRRRRASATAPSCSSTPTITSASCRSTSHGPGAVDGVRGRRRLQVLPAGRGQLLPARAARRARCGRCSPAGSANSARWPTPRAPDEVRYGEGAAPLGRRHLRSGVALSRRRRVRLLRRRRASTPSLLRVIEPAPDRPDRRAGAGPRFAGDGGQRRAARARRARRLRVGAHAVRPAARRGPVCRGGATPTRAGSSCAWGRRRM